MYLHVQPLALISLAKVHYFTTKYLKTKFNTKSETSVFNHILYNELLKRLIKYCFKHLFKNYCLQKNKLFNYITFDMNRHGIKRLIKFKRCKTERETDVNINKS